MAAETFLSGLASDLRSALTPAQRKKTEARASWLLEFIEQHVPTDHGRYTLDRHVQMREIVALLERVAIHRESETRVDVVKAEQIGFTTFALGYALWLVAEQGYNVGYFLPDDKFASEFGMARLNPIVDGSAYLTSLMEDAAVDRGTLKQIGEKFLYMLGLAKIKGATSRPMDLQISDEVDLTSEAVRKWKAGRMAASKLRVELDVSAPYRQDSGIDKRYKEGSQRRWLVKCAACGQDDICMEEVMDLHRCFRQFSGTWVRVCPKCSRKLDLGAGRWVATYPERERDRLYSYRLSAISSEAIDPAFLMAQYEKALDDPEAMPIFDRTRRGIANAGALQPFTEAKLREMERDYVLRCSRSGNPTFIGADVGNACWFWVEDFLPEGRARLIWAEKVSSDSYRERALELIRIFQPQMTVVDYMPLFNESRKIAYAHPRRVAVQQFENGKEPQLVEEKLVVEGTVGAARKTTGPTYLCVKGDRNMILGGFAEEAKHVEKGLLIPARRAGEPRIMALVREHLAHLQQDEIVDGRGNRIRQFRENCENHLGMAAASARQARRFAPQIHPFVPVMIPGTTRGAELREHILGDDRRPRGDRRSRMKGLEI